jgi:hypothetical protein
VAKNGPKGKGRIGAVRGRKQFYNPQNDTWYKVNTETNRIMDGKADGTPFKGVEKI